MTRRRNEEHLNMVVYVLNHAVSTYTIIQYYNVRVLYVHTYERETSYEVQGMITPTVLRPGDQNTSSISTMYEVWCHVGMWVRIFACTVLLTVVVVEVSLSTCVPVRIVLTKKM